MAPQSHQQQQQPNPQLCEEKIIASLRQAYPNHRFVGEESTFAGTADTGTDPATPTWYIDPVDGTVGDLTIRSMGVLRAADTPPITVTIDPALGDTRGTPVPAGDAVVAAVALAVWRHQGLPPVWPTRQPLRSP